jgi:hypothetical protein
MLMAGADNKNENARPGDPPAFGMAAAKVTAECSHSCRGTAERRIPNLTSNDDDDELLVVVREGRNCKAAVLMARPARTVGKISVAVSISVVRMSRAFELELMVSDGGSQQNSSFLSSVVLVMVGLDLLGQEAAHPAATANAMAPPSRHKTAVGPNKPQVMAALSKPADWDAVRKASAAARGTPPPLFLVFEVFETNNPAAMGRAPQLQSGVARPKSAAWNSPLVDLLLLLK